MLATQDMRLSRVAQKLQQVLHQTDLLQLQAARLAAQFAATEEYDDQGFATPIDWIRLNCHVTSNVAADLIAVGKNLERMPGSLQAVANSEIGFAHVKAMARTASADLPALCTRRDGSPLARLSATNSPRHACRSGKPSEH